MDELIHEPIWFSERKPLSFPKHEGKITADVLVVGGGITGVSTAYYLLEKGYSVVLLEKSRIGKGATGASTGILNQELDVDLVKLIKNSKQDYAKAIRKFSEDAIGAMEGFVSLHNVSCDFERASTLTLIRNKDAVASLREEVRLKKSLGFNVRFVEQEELQARLRANAWGAVEDLNDAIINPYAFTQGMAVLVQSKGGLQYEDSPLVSYRESGSMIEATTPGGVINVSYLVIATGASLYNSGLVYPIQTTVVATAPLPNTIRDDFFGKGRESLLDTRRIYHYARFTPDNRVLFGGEDISMGKPGYKSCENELDAAEKLRKDLLRLFPHVEDIRLTHAWSGVFDQTVDDLPYCRMSDSGRIIGIGGYGGSGIALGFMFGKKIAELMRGESTQLTDLFGVNKRGFLFRASSSRIIPMYVKKSAVSLYLTYLKCRDSLQDKV